MFCVIGNLAIHATFQYEYGANEPKIWTANLGGSRWVRIFKLIIIISRNE